MKIYKIDLDRNLVYVFRNTDKHYHYYTKLDLFKCKESKTVHIRYYKLESVGE